MKNFMIAHKEAFKSILLVVLVFTMVGQTIYTWSFGLDMSVVPDNSVFADFVKLLGYNKDGSKVTSELESASFPIQAMVQGKNGLFGVQYNENGVGVVFDKTKSLWRTAFDNADKLKDSSEENFRMALTKPFLFLKYDGSIPTEIIAGWLGSDFSDGENSETPDAECLLLSRLDNNDYCMYIRDARTGTIFEIKTKIAENEFLSATDSFLANDCKLAMDSGEEFEKYLPETIVFNSPMRFDVLKSSEPSFVSQEKIEGTAGKDSTRRLLEAFFYNPYTSKKYDENNGNIQNFVENFRTLRVEKSGRIRFEASDIRGGIEAYPRGKMSGRDADMQCIELGRSITQNAIASMKESGQNSNGHVALTKWYISPKTNTNVAVFSVRFDGIPIDSEFGFFARYEFRGNMMISAVLNMRQYSKVENVKQLYILPEKQLAAAIGDEKMVGICVRYDDTGENRCMADWKLYSRVQ